MWEFAIRLVGAGLVLLISGWTEALPFDVAWKICAATTAYAVLAYLVEQKKLTNPGFAGLMAGLDALAIGATLAYSGALESLGLLVVMPIVFAVAKRGSNPLATGPIGAAALLFSGPMANGGMPTPVAFAQSAAVLAIALLVNQPRLVIRPQTIREMISELAEENAQPNQEESNTQALIELRERYRRLTSAFRDLERRSRIDRIVAQLMLGRREPGNDFGRIVEKLRAALDADGIVLSTATQSVDRMIVAASAGTVPAESNGLSFAIKPTEAAYHLKDKAELALRSLTGTEAGQSRFNTLLRYRGLVVGMLTVFVKDPEKIEEMHQRADEAAEAIAHIVMDEKERRRITRRATEAELMYEIVARLDGATTQPDLGKRVCKLLQDCLHCEHIGVWTLNGTEPMLLAKHGKAVRLFESLRFEPVGLEGWINQGAPVIAAYSTSDHIYVDQAVAAKARLGSYLLVPILAGDVPIGFLTAGSAPHSALTPDDLKVMRDSAYELAHAFSAINGSTQEQSRGMLSVPEFQEAVVSMDSEKACMVYFEPLKFSDVAEEVGPATLEQAARQLGLLIRRHAPLDGQVCRKSDGSYIVLLPRTDFAAAETWANEVATTAAMRNLEGSPGIAPVSLAVKARVADLDSKPEIARDSRQIRPWNPDSSTVTS